MFQHKRAWLLVLPLIYLLLYFQVFTANYAYLDEIHQLWHNGDGSNYTMFFTQGRGLTGWLMNKLFGTISTIEELKYIRILSLAGWMFTSCLFYILFSKWSEKIGFSNSFIVVANIFIICSAPVAIYIGWASCVELFIAIATGLLGCHLLFSALYKQEGPIISVPNLTLLFCAGLGVVSLFFYQSAFGIFLIPFFLKYTHSREVHPGKRVIIAIIVYLLIYVLYYFIFQYQLRHSQLQAGDRVGISYDLWGKFKFFFGDPLASGFSMNFLYSPRRIFSIIIFVLMLSGWLSCYFIRNRNEKISHNLYRVFYILVFLIMMYIPSMIAIENFAAYRTMFVINLSIFLLLLQEFLHIIAKRSKAVMMIGAVCMMLIITGFYNFNYQYINPLKKEYDLARNYMQQNLNDHIDTVHFVRAEKFLFRSHQSIEVYRDEFGLPSTHKDWVPDPLVRQLVFELTGNRERAEKITVIQSVLENKSTEATKNNGSSVLVDINRLWETGPVSQTIDKN